MIKKISEVSAKTAQAKQSDSLIVNWTREFPTESGDYLYSSAMTKGVVVLSIAYSKQGILVCTNAKNMPLADFSKMFANAMWSSSKIEVPR